MKHLVASLLYLLFFVSATFAATETVNGITWGYTIENGAALLGIESNRGNQTISTSTTGVVTIPSNLGGCPVTGIRSGAFSGCSKLTSIAIPNSVTLIGTGAFSQCTNLPKDEDGVQYESNERKVLIAAPTSLTGEFLIPNTVRFIHSYAFSGCSKLTSITIPSSVTLIGERAFSGCRGLTSITIPEGVTTLGLRIIDGCDNLTKLVLPSTITTWESLNSEGCFYSAFSQSSIQEVTLSEGLTSIGRGAFAECRNLTSVTIPNSVTSIGEAAFFMCEWIDFNYPQEYATKLQNAILCIRKEAGSDSNGVVKVVAEMATPTRMKVTYTIQSVKKKVKVYALAFEDGECSFAKVVPVKTGAVDSPEPVPNGSEVTTNEPHTFIWNVPADWDTDLSKVRVEILVQEGELLPFELITIPANGAHPEITISENTMYEYDLFNALLWCYASGDTMLKNKNGVVTVNGMQIAHNRLIPRDAQWNKSITGVSSDNSWETKATALLNYLYGKMGYKVLSGDDLTYANQMMRLELPSSGLKQRAVKITVTSEK